MHLDASGWLWLVELVFFLIAIFPLTYCVFKHGWKGLLGWAYLEIFCILRIVSAAINISAENGGKVSTAVAAITRVGISPLLLAALGILHESGSSIQKEVNPVLRGWTFLILHLITMGVLALVVNGNSASMEKVKFAMLVFLSIWLVTLGLALLSFSYPRSNYGETLLIRSVLFALPSVGIRVLYSVLGAFNTSNTFNSSTGPIAVRVLLGVIEELSTVAIFAVAGILSRDVHRNAPTKYYDAGTYNGYSRPGATSSYNMDENPETRPFQGYVPEYV
ncbi:hypothetical protein F5884DRAFT_875465 [Xylogone sp. PMI_703]|nr:hypothetical protein F5884DRAFT_875465 [Xylogone sp. PMI_703]